MKELLLENRNSPRQYLIGFLQVLSLRLSHLQGMLSWPILVGKVGLSQPSKDKIINTPLSYQAKNPMSTTGIV